MEAPITTSIEALLMDEYEPTPEWAPHPDLKVVPTMSGEVGDIDVPATERELTRRCARRILDVFYDVNQEFIKIELGIIQ